MTANEWAAEHDVTPGHLSHVVSGNRDSDKLIAQIDAFIAKHLGDRTAAA